MPVDYFNATMTYRKDSAYYWPYGKFEKRKEHENIEDIITEGQVRGLRWLLIFLFEQVHE